jgi:lysylphosphatidylglycerol synthetase-like protein (DUF2156 family)
MQKSEAPDRTTIVERVRRFGNSFSDAVLDPINAIFTHPSIDGLIGYRAGPSIAVAYGDPICAQSDRPALAQAFREFCHGQGLRIIYLAATEDFAKWAIRNGSGALIEFGEELSIDPHNDPKSFSGEAGHVVRRKVKHALKEGVGVKELPAPDESLQKKIEAACMAWLDSRRGPQIHVAHAHLFQDPQGKRWFYAGCNDRVVGVVQISRIETHQGWLLSYLMHTPEAPQGTQELLVSEVLDTLAREGCSYMTFGAATIAGLGEMQGFGKMASGFAKALFKWLNGLFHLDSRGKFLHKFHPQSKPLYLVFDTPHIGWRELAALMRAVNVKFSKGSR